MKVPAILLLSSAIARADPEKPTLPGQYTVLNVSTVTETNAMVPNEIIENIEAEYFDYDKQMKRIDVAYSSYGDHGPYMKIYDYADLFSNFCGPLWPDVMAPRGYQIEADGTCCYANLVDNCPSMNPGDPMPTAETMTEPALPRKLAFLDSTDKTELLPGMLVDVWESNIFVPNTTTPFMTQDYYFDGNDHETQRANFVHILAGSQYVNGTTIYNGEWTLGPQDASLFDISQYDCSSECRSTDAQVMRLTSHRAGPKPVEAK